MDGCEGLKELDRQDSIGSSVSLPRGLEYITEEDFTEVDLKWLTKAAKGWDKDLEEVLDAVKNHVAQIWRVDLPGAEGLLVTRLQVDPNDNVPEIYIWHLAGKGILQYAEFIVDVIMVFGKATGAKRVSAYAKPGIARLLKKRSKFKTEHVYVTREIPNG